MIDLHMNDAPEIAPIIDPNQSQREAVRRGIAQFQLRLQAAGHDFREPPPEHLGGKK